ncbi:cupredoxin family protein [Ancylobacter dichloromethanicus]|uniref:Copper tolerance protein n=1 Tax=Ancylobacter dichloromethanicus TaxID=518825 RepID=A0A9W6JBQ2_9HYPH|nr:cupredoxin family protein [Ancylobacter dichloromethanicus]MBS7552960.1 cupredoxin family protein [Ancylobacter dichloromethanicus]GLK74566.1 copper tolerance protein [Ancylobacter dichloromethanicus]
MQTKIVLAAIAAFSLSTSALADAGHSHDNKPYGVPGDAKKSARIVQVAMTEQDDKMLFVPNRIEVRKGEQVRFVMKNHGASDHEFVLGTHDEIVAHAEQMRKNPDMEHDDPNSKRLSANQNGDIVWRFTNAGTFEFACLIPGHMESGMVGTIIVK